MQNDQNILGRGNLCKTKQWNNLQNQIPWSLGTSIDIFSHSPVHPGANYSDDCFEVSPDLQFKSSWPRRLRCLLPSSSVVVKIPHSFLASTLGTFPIFHDISTCSYFQHQVHDMSISHCISLCLVDFDVSLRRLPAGRADPALAVYLDRSVTSAKTCAVNPMTMAKRSTNWSKILQNITK